MEAIVNMLIENLVPQTNIKTNPLTIVAVNEHFLTSDYNY